MCPFPYCEGSAPAAKAVRRGPAGPADVELARDAELCTLIMRRGSTM